MNRWTERAASLRSLPHVPSLPTLPSRSELLDFVGLEPRRSRGRSLGQAVPVFLLGVLAGGLLALLLAPQASAHLGAGDDDLADESARSLE